MPNLFRVFSGKTPYYVVAQDYNDAVSSWEKSHPMLGITCIEKIEGTASVSEQIAVKIAAELNPSTIRKGKYVTEDDFHAITSHESRPRSKR